MEAPRKQSKAKTLDAVLSKISERTGYVPIFTCKPYGGQLEELKTLSEGQVKVEVQSKEEEKEPYVRPVRLIPRTGLERSLVTPSYHGNKTKTVVVPRNNTDSFGKWEQLPTNPNGDSKCVPVQIDREELEMIEPKENGRSISVETRRTLLDAYLYQGSENVPSDVQFSSYGFPTKDTFVVVHPSESVGIVCKVCRRTFATKKGLKRHCKDFHKTSTINIVGNKEKDGDLKGPAKSLKNKVLTVSEKKTASPLKLLKKVEKRVEVPAKPKQKNDKGKSEGLAAKKNAVNIVNARTGTADEEYAAMGSVAKNEKLKHKKGWKDQKEKVAVGKKNMAAEKNVSGGKVSKAVSKKDMKNDLLLQGDKMKQREAAKEVKRKFGKEGESEKWLGNKSSNNTMERKRKTLDESPSQPAKKTTKKDNASLTSGSKANEKEHVFPFHCNECGEGFKSSLSLEKHVPVHSMLKYHCYRCNDVFMNLRSLTKHLLVHENEPPVEDHLHRCRVCSQGFKTSRQLRGHLLEHERVGNPEEQLPKGRHTSQGHHSPHGTKLSSNKNQKGDLSSSKLKAKEGTLTCKCCQIEFSSHPELREHMNEKHVGLEDASFRCDKCNNVFVSKGDLARHLVKEHRMSRKRAFTAIRKKGRLMEHKRIDSLAEDSKKLGQNFDVSRQESDRDTVKATQGIDENSISKELIASQSNLAGRSDGTLELEVLEPGCNSENYPQLEGVDLDLDGSADATFPGSDESCVLEERESAQILQALFIKVDGETDVQESEEPAQITPVTESSIIANCTGQGKNSAAKLSDADSGLVKSDTPFGAVKQSLVGSHETLPMKGDLASADNSLKERRVTEPLVDTSKIGLEDEANGVIDWFWKNDENENRAERPVKIDVACDRKVNAHGADCKKPCSSSRQDAAVCGVKSANVGNCVRGEVDVTECGSDTRENVLDGGASGVTQSSVQNGFGTLISSTVDNVAPRDSKVIVDQLSDPWQQHLCKNVENATPHCDNTVKTDEDIAKCGDTSKESLKINEPTVAFTEHLECQEFGGESDIMKQKGRSMKRKGPSLQGTNACLNGRSVAGDDSMQDSCPLASFIYVRRRAAVIGEEKMHNAKKCKTVCDPLGLTVSSKLPNGHLPELEQEGTCDSNERKGVDVDEVSVNSQLKANVAQTKNKKPVLKCSNSVDDVNTCFGPACIHSQSDSQSLKCSQCDNSFLSGTDLPNSIGTTCTASPKANCNVSLKPMNSEKRASTTKYTRTGTLGTPKKGQEKELNVCSELRMSLETGEKRFRCEACGKAFNTSYFLRLHKRRHENDDVVGNGPALFACDVCDQVMSSGQSLAKHTKLHGAGKCSRKVERKGVVKTTKLKQSVLRKRYRERARKQASNAKKK